MLTAIVVFFGVVFAICELPSKVMKGLRDWPVLVARIQKIVHGKKTDRNNRDHP